MTRRVGVSGLAPEPAILGVARRLSRSVGRLRFAEPVTHVYNPLAYAWAPHAAYLARYGVGEREVLLLGMNPGPFGMAQTGIPFGDPGLVRAFLGIEGEVGRPRSEHPARPIRGFASARREVSGERFWGWVRARFGTADAFFARFFVLNHCPLVFLEASGKNRTPDRLPPAEREPLLTRCDEALADFVALLRPSLLVGVGRYAEARLSALVARGAAGRGVRVASIPHPSPANPAANADWGGQASRALEALGVLPSAATGARGAASERK